MKVFLRIIKGIITIFLLVVLVIVAFQKLTRNKVAIGNLYVFQIVSESMLPEYRIGDIIVVKKTKIDDLKVGDDVTYLGSANNFDGLTITHRIIDIRVEDGKRYFTTKGMSNYIEDPEISEESIYGKVVYHTKLFSFVGRLMTNIVIYYLLFITVGVSFSYEFITSYLIKKKDDDVSETENDSEEVEEKQEVEEELEQKDETEEISTEEELEEKKETEEKSLSFNSLVADTNNNEGAASLGADNELEEVTEDGDETEDGGTKK